MTSAGPAPSRPLAATSVREALDSALVALGAAGVDTPRLDAELLLAEAMGCDRTRLAADSGAPVTGAAVRAFREAVRRRSVDREPLAYILGRKGFRHLDLAVDRRVLVPRPETELLVEVALELPAGARVIDVGTGSGAIALALKDERPDLEVVATDVSADALAVARANGQRLGLDVRFEQADLLPADLAVDAVLSNPPYVAERDHAGLAPEIVRHEPALALVAGADGLDVIRRLVHGAVRAAPLVALEVGAGQAGAVAGLLAAAGCTDVRARRDLAGIDRVVVGRR